MTTHVFTNVLKIKMFQKPISPRMKEYKNSSNLTFKHLKGFITMDVTIRYRLFFDCKIKDTGKLINNKKYLYNFEIGQHSVIHCKCYN